MQQSARASAIYRRLLGHVRPHRQVFLLSLLGMLALASTEWILPALLRYLVDEEFGRTVGQYSLLIPLALVALFAARGAMSYVATVGLSWVAHRVVMDLRALMFRKLVALPARFFDTRSAGELISKFTFDVTQVSQAATHSLTVLVKDSGVVAALLAYLMYLNWRLAITLLLLGPVVAWVIRRVSRRLREMSRRLQASMGELNAVAEEVIGGHRDIKVFGGQDYEINRFQRAINNARKFQMKVIGTAAATEPLVQLLIALAIGLMMILALRESAAGLMTRGDFVSFVTATALLLPPVKRLTGVNEHLQRGLAAAESIFALVDEPPEAPGGNASLAAVRGAIEFRDVTVAYGETPVLSGFSLSIAPGESVALVGPSGAGKTSVANLLPRFYEPQSGQVLLDGRPLEVLDLVSLRGAIGYVGQHVVLFNDSIWNNIAYGALREAPPERVRAAAAAAHVDEFALRLPQGYETPIGDDGVRLSGGQRQRLAIARALLKDAPILILDEATSALDSESERRIQEALGVLRRGRTCLIIAHRLSTVENADRIVVLERGRIVEQGTHAELLKAGGAYAALRAAQGEARPRPLPA